MIRMLVEGRNTVSINGAASGLALDGAEVLQVQRQEAAFRLARAHPSLFLLPSTRVDCCSYSTVQ